MRKWSSFFLLSIVCFAARSQNPVEWKYSLKKISRNNYSIKITAVMENGWHVYAQQQPKEAIGQPTVIHFAANPLITFIGKTGETGKKEIFSNKEMGIIQYQYADSVIFNQEIFLKEATRTNISGTILFQACTDEMCLPPKSVAFSIAVN